MSDLKSEIFNAFNTLIPPGPVLIGYSGGLDSTVLLALFSEYSQRKQGLHPLKVIHVHHGLSPNADQWAAHCQAVCAQFDVPCIVERVQLIKGARQSLEDVARKARYDVFARYLTSGSLLTAHHQDDQLETLLLALKRGSGPRGLAGMPPVLSFAQGKLIRPLLNISREAMALWASEQGLSWIEDESNADDAYDRNFLRNQIIPHLKSRWPEFGKTAARSASLCAEQEALISEVVQQDLATLMTEYQSLDIAKLSVLSIVRRKQVMRHWLRELTGSVPSAHQLELMWHEVALAREDAMPAVMWEAGSVRRYRNQLWQVPPLPEIVFTSQHPIELNQAYSTGIGRLSLQQTSADSCGLRKPNSNEVVSIRFNLLGSEKIQPANRTHHRELKKLWHEWHVAPWLRSLWPVICYNDVIVAIPGLCIVKEFQCVNDEEKLKIDWTMKEI